MHQKDFLKILLVIILRWDMKREKQTPDMFMFFKSCDKKAKVTLCPLANGDTKMCLFLAWLYFDVLKMTAAAGPMSSK